MLAEKGIYECFYRRGVGRGLGVTLGIAVGVTVGVTVGVGVDVALDLGVAVGVGLPPPDTVGVTGTATRDATDHYYRGTYQLGVFWRLK